MKLAVRSAPCASILIEKAGLNTLTYPVGLSGKPARELPVVGDLSDPSVFNNGATGDRKGEQEYYIAYAQDEWRLNSKVTLNYGMRYEYYSPLREARDLNVQFNINTGQIFPQLIPSISLLKPTSVHELD